MNPEKPERKPLKTIDKSGVYELKLTNPKPEKYKLNAAGFPSVWLFFVDTDGNCVSKYYSVQYGKSLAMLIGKLSGKFTKTLPESATIEQLQAHVETAVNCIGRFEIVCTPNGEWNGKPQYKYKFAKVEPVVKLGTIKNDAAVQFEKDNEPF